VNRLVIASTNPHKIYEVRAALADLKGWEIVAQSSDIIPAEETGATLMENAVLKAVHTSRFVDDLVLADDSGLCVDVLDGRPGVFSHRYADTDLSRIQRVLTELQSVPDKDRGAAFVCALALARKGKVEWTDEGRVDGFINREPKGSNGFGYDPIFLVSEYDRTMAELSIEEKNKTSHRGRALRKLVQHFAGSGRL
jgi:XTP/dITP diphosphohydrolase